MWNSIVSVPDHCLFMYFAEVRVDGAGRCAGRLFVCPRFVV